MNSRWVSSSINGINRCRFRQSLPRSFSVFHARQGINWTIAQQKDNWSLLQTFTHTQGSTQTIHGLPGVTDSFTQKRPTDQENKKPTWHALGWRFVGTKNESSVSSDWKETIQPIWRRSLLLFQRWPTTTSLWLRIDFQEFFFSSCPVWHKRNGNYSKAISLWWLICIRLLSECPTVEMGGINTILRTEIRRRKKRILHHLTATTTAITIQRITIKLFFRFLFK